MNVISGEKKNCVILVRGRNHLDGLVDERKIMRVTGCPLISAHKESIYRVMVNKEPCQPCRNPCFDCLYNSTSKELAIFQKWALKSEKDIFR